MQVDITPDEFQQLKAMEDAFYKQDVDFFVGLLENFSSQSLLIIVHAVCMLENVGNENSVPILCKIMRSNPSHLTRHEAASTLGQVGYLCR